MHTIGTSTKEYSTLFELGSKGLTISTLLQLLFLSMIVIFIFSIFTAIVIFVFAFGWFPVSDIRAWIGFIISFSISMTVSLIITRFIEKSENRKMQEALDNYNSRKQDEQKA